MGTNYVIIQFEVLWRRTMYAFCKRLVLIAALVGILSLLVGCANIGVGYHYSVGSNSNTGASMTPDTPGSNTGMGFGIGF